jgi:Flp pilus assembly secretin CpaC
MIVIGLPFFYYRMTMTTLVGVKSQFSFLNMKRIAIGLLALTAAFGADAKLSAQTEATAANAESVIVYPSISVTVNKSVVLRLPRKARRVSVTQPQIAEAFVVAPDQILINGKAIGTTSLVVWLDESRTSKK